MKKLYPLMVVITLLLQHCSNPEESPLSEKIQFTFSPSVITDNGGRISSTFGDVHALRLSLEKNTGETVFTMRDIELIHFGDALITEPVELKGGSYRVTDFLLVDADGNVLYATPKKGSALAGLVSQALPFYFSVTKSVTANIEVGVMDITHRAPEDFGYASFNVREVLAFQLSPMILQGGQYSFTNAKGYITQDGAPIFTIDLGAKVNVISFKGDASKTYTLKVVKDRTYTTFTKEFVYADLLEELNGLPLKATLNETLTLTTSNLYFNVMLRGTPDINVDWGDGTITTEPNEYDRFEHTFTDENPHNVVVTGDLEHIKVFDTYYDDGRLDSLNIVHLVGLETFAAGLGNGPRVLDLSHTTKLKFIDITGMHLLEELRLPATHQIQYMLVSGHNSLDAADINAIIDSIYEKAVLYNIRDGVFELVDIWYEPTGPIGPPSADRMAKLQDLRDSYEWTVRPE
ncbi:MAG: hypothetical protein WDO14_20200 [Bacteroidota bacterium]